MLIAMIPLFSMAIATQRCARTTATGFSGSLLDTQKEGKRGQVPGGRTYTRTILTEASGRKIPRALESKALATRGREQPCGLLYRSARPERDAGDVAFLPRTIVSRL